MYKAILGKTFWKSVILPSTLHAASACLWTKRQIKRIQIIQNQVFSGLLNLPKNAPVAYTHGEIGASYHQQRDGKMKLGLLVHIMQNTSYLKTLVLKHICNQKITWIRHTMEIVTILGYDINELQHIDKELVFKRFAISQETHWRHSVHKNGKLGEYLKWKKTCTRTSDLINNQQETNLRRYQSNCITNIYNERCMCGGELTSEHLIKHCRLFFNITSQYNDFKSMDLSTILFENKNHDIVLTMISKIEKQRKSISKESS